jgi:hypothetical protein
MIAWIASCSVSSAIDTGTSMRRITVGFTWSSAIFRRTISMGDDIDAASAWLAAKGHHGTTGSRRRTSAAVCGRPERARLSAYCATVIGGMRRF